MAIIGYDAEKEEVSNEEKIKNCFSLSIIMLVGMPLVGVLLYFLKNIVIDSGQISEESGKQVFSAYVIIAIFLTVGITFTLLYLRRKLKKEAKESQETEED
jgi:heme/copper-type cytochrome/quinol oxidase subunit 2